MAKSKPTNDPPIKQEPPRGRRARTTPPKEQRPIASSSTETVRETPEWIPVLPLRDVVIYPYMIFPVLVGRESSLGSVTAAIGRERYLFLVAQRDPEQEEPKTDELYRFGTLTKVVRIIRLPNGLMKVLVDGMEQAMATEYTLVDTHLEAKLTVLQPRVPPASEIEALTRHAGDLFKEYVTESHNVPPETLMALDNITDPRRRLFYMAAHLTKDLESKQRLLEITDLRDQYIHLTTLLAAELDILKIEQEIDEKVQSTIQKSQRKYFLAEQIRVLQEEIGEEIDEQHPEFGKLVEQLNAAGLSEQARARADEELGRLKKQPPLSPEGSVIRTYLEWLAQVPWNKRSHDHLNIEHVQNVLERDHYGLEKPKERILEHIAVLNLVEKIRGQILCLVGPPGVGKTSLARSIATALGREFIRISLGGVRDEAEIRGHRRTYIGALPGKIIQSMKRAGVVNPLILLDEVDKMSTDFRGDPSSALLEVLDPEQNQSFTDHYLEVEYDLSNVFFVTTANVRYNIPPPLADRMEIIDIPGYLEYDKLEIAKQHIIPNQLHAHGLPVESVTFEDAAILRIIRQYTEEAGVRNLVRQIARICRKVAREVVTKAYQETPDIQKTDIGNEQPITVNVVQNDVHLADENGVTEAMNGQEQPREPLRVPEGFHVTLTTKSLNEYLGVPKHQISKSELNPKIGAVMGLAWTSTGGDVLPVETVLVEGSERLTLTGQLGDVMKESAQAALTFIRARCRELKVPRDFTKHKEIHVHLPEGAIPKDGPSAGITLIMAIISAASGKPARGDLAMTGEITLRGNVLPIGGLQEKLLAAKRAGIKVVIIPEDNRLSLTEIPEAIKDGLNIITVKTVDQATPIVFDLTTPAAQLKAKEHTERKDVASTLKKRKKAKPIAKKRTARTRKA